MSAGDRDTLASLLAEHKIVGWGREPWTAKCKCGIETIAPVSKTNFMPPNHAAHLADVIASSDWLREQRAEAWKAGHG